MKSQRSLSGNKNVILASYEVIQLVAKSGKERQNFSAFFLSLESKVRAFLLETRFINLLTDCSWLCPTTYLAEHINVLNSNLQGVYIDIFHIEIEATIKKFEI